MYLSHTPKLQHWLTFQTGFYTTKVCDGWSLKGSARFAAATYEQQYVRWRLPKTPPTPLNTLRQPPVNHTTTQASLVLILHSTNTSQHSTNNFSFVFFFCLLRPICFFQAQRYQSHEWVSISNPLPKSLANRLLVTKSMLQDCLREGPPAVSVNMSCSTQFFRVLKEV